MIAIELLEVGSGAERVGVGIAEQVCQHTVGGGAGGLLTIEKAILIAIQKMKPARQIFLPTLRIRLAVHENMQPDQHRPALVEEKHILDILNRSGISRLR